MTQWTRGQSGNPAGRPVGSKNVQTELREALDAHGKDLLDQLVEKAKAGESTALRFLLKRLLPSAKSTTIQVPLQLEGTPVQQAEQIKNRLAEGLLTFEEARGLLAAIHTVELTREAAELSQKVRELEEKLNLVGHVQEALRPARQSRPNLRAHVQAVQSALGEYPDVDSDEYVELDEVPQEDRDENWWAARFGGFQLNLIDDLSGLPADVAEELAKQVQGEDLEAEAHAIRHEQPGNLPYPSEAKMIACLRRTAKKAPEVAKTLGVTWGVAWEPPGLAPAQAASPPVKSNGVGGVPAGAAPGGQTQH
jgi:hypothetical protein